MSMKKFSNSNFLIYLSLCFIFVQELKINDTAISLYGNLLSLFFLFLIFVTKEKYVYYYIFFLLIGILVSLLYTFLNIEILIDSLKLYSYIAIYSIIVLKLSIDQYSNKLVRIILFIIPAYIILFYLNVGSTITYGQHRMQGLLSEPSALAFPVAVFFLYALVQKSLYLFVIAVVAIFLSQSPTVILVSFASLLLFFSFKIRYRYITLLVIVVFLIAFNILDMLKYLKSYEIQVFERLYSGVKFLFTFGEVGYNPRLENLFLAYEHFINGNIFIGNGLNSLSYMASQNDMLRDFNIVFEILYSFGLFGLSIFSILLLLTYQYIKNIKNNKIEIVFSTIVCYTFTNSAQGIAFQAILYNFLVYSLFYYCRRLHVKPKSFSYSSFRKVL